MCVWLCFFFFFFKQKTAYEMRISDWSSDVCSSDLSAQVRRCRREETASDHRTERRRSRASQTEHRRIFANRSEERRVGKSVSVRVDLGGRRIIKKKKQKEKD